MVRCREDVGGVNESEDYARVCVSGLHVDLL